MKIKKLYEGKTLMGFYKCPFEEDTVVYFCVSGKSYVQDREEECEVSEEEFEEMIRTLAKEGYLVRNQLKVDQELFNEIRNHLRSPFSDN